MKRFLFTIGLVTVLAVVVWAGAAVNAGPSDPSGAALMDSDTVEEPEAMPMEGDTIDEPFLPLLHEGDTMEEPEAMMDDGDTAEPEAMSSGKTRQLQDDDEYEDPDDDPGYEDEPDEEPEPDYGDTV